MYLAVCVKVKFEGCSKHSYAASCKWHKLTHIYSYIAYIVYSAYAYSRFIGYRAIKLGTPQLVRNWYEILYNIFYV